MPEEIGAGIIRALDPLMVRIVGGGSLDRIRNYLSLGLPLRGCGFRDRRVEGAARIKEFKDAISRAVSAASRA